jgi:hypothetical protein
MAGPKDRKHSHGHDKSTRESRVSLAAYLRQRFPMVVIADMYEILLMSKMPLIEKVPEDEECHENCDCGLRVVADPDQRADRKPTIDHMMLTIARIMERSYGQPAQHMHIEAEIKAEVTAIAGGVDPRYLSKLSPQALLAIRNAVKGLPPAALPSGEPDVEVIDATSRDVSHEGKLED